MHENLPVSLQNTDADYVEIIKWWLKRNGTISGQGRLAHILDKKAVECVKLFFTFMPSHEQSVFVYPAVFFSF